MRVYLTSSWRPKVLPVVRLSLAWRVMDALWACQDYLSGVAARMSQPHDMLYVPLESLSETIAVIREGLKRAPVSEETREGLEEWCRWQQEYLERTKAEPDAPT